MPSRPIARLIDYLYLNVNPRSKTPTIEDKGLGFSVGHMPQACANLRDTLLPNLPSGELLMSPLMSSGGEFFLMEEWLRFRFCKSLVYQSNSTNSCRRCGESGCEKL